MKLYSSFLIRCWVIRDSDQGKEEKFVFDVEHIQKGDHVRISNPAEAVEWLIKALKAEPLEADPPVETLETDNQPQRG